MVPHRAKIRFPRCYGWLLLAGAVAGCAPVLPSKTLFIAARETTSNELLVGTFETIFGEPTSSITLFGIGDRTECRGITGVGGVDRVAPGTTTRLMMKCEDGRFIQGELTYERFDRGAGLAEDNGDKLYQLVFGRLKLSEESLRQEFALLPPPPERPRLIEPLPAALPPAPAELVAPQDQGSAPPAVPTENVEVGRLPAEEGAAAPSEDDDEDDPFANLVPSDDGDAAVADECVRGSVDGQCLDEFDLDEFDSNDVENFLRDEEDTGDEVET
ncbi:MAG: hypothetical protein HQ495_06270 [Alphaproteobacteria bacterium]|nr:hypothetical protein [Alphaproteobacteria bacterium]